MANDRYSFIFLKTVAITLLFLTLFFLLTLVSLSIFAYRQLTLFTTQAGTTPRELYQLLQTGWNQTPIHTHQRKNILLLGLDSLETRSGSQPLTDTMMIASLNFTNGEVRTVSLPRDLWNEEYHTKINALYFYGQEKYPSEPEKFPTEVLSQMTQVPIHHTVILSLDQVATLIDMIGGVEVEVPQTFTDSEFPRPDVDVTRVTDPKLLYQTVTFTQGSEKMAGERALQFIRSRHAEGEEGSDVARSNRQQLVIQSLMHALMDQQLLANPEKLGTLYRFYDDNFSQALPLTEAVATVKALLPVKNMINFQPQTLTYYPEEAEGNIYHPPVTRVQPQWIYAIRDETLFTQEVEAKLNLRDTN